MKIITVSRQKASTHANDFTIGGYVFSQGSVEMLPIPIYNFSIDKQFEKAIDVESWIKDNFGDNVECLSNYPREVSDYIKDHESYNRFDDASLFHDIRAKYLIIVLDSERRRDNNIMFIGYTTLGNSTNFAIKAFSFDDLIRFAKKFSVFCAKNSIRIDEYINIRWIKLESLLNHKDSSSNNGYTNTFLSKTLKPEFFNLFRNSFNELDKVGYLNEEFFDNKVNINNNPPQALKEVKQFFRWFSKFWKTEIKSQSKDHKILCLHDEINEYSSKDEKLVYTFKPNLLRYYQLYWFENLCTCLLQSKLSSHNINIKNILSGHTFTFGPDLEREIDILLGITFNNEYRVIAIECKKTLSNTEIKETNSKNKRTVLSSKVVLIDAFVHIGLFNKDVQLLKTSPNGNKYGESKLTYPSINEDVPYYAFIVESIDVFEELMSFIIKDVCTQW